MAVGTVDTAVAFDVQQFGNCLPRSHYRDVLAVEMPFSQT